ncbi:2'-deoxynucleoside 5'-phosphate N-hydrolase 1 [Monodon monoceros]|uniref:2'-deoxynucleoside 5'-phosphate N-hydrolase 1 n=1 Tax=Monodon monoceros TaxID=40151 RepID=UPI0010F6AA61|nr:2'-deoxynucleoside 5'-phosphate N-hydrolase 1 [Monodon monoceros]
MKLPLAETRWPGGGGEQCIRSGGPRLLPGRVKEVREAVDSHTWVQLTSPFHKCGHSCTGAPRAGRITCRRRAPPGAGREVRRLRPERGEPGRPSLYVGGSIPGGREDRELYGRIVSRLRRFGAELTEHLAAADQGAGGEEAAGGNRLIHEQDLAWLQQAEEVAQPSLGIGYELDRAVARSKPVLCLFRPQSDQMLSATIRGAAEGLQVQVWGYEAAEEAAMLDAYFAVDPPERWLLP